jgi:hypothetical protein
MAQLTNSLRNSRTTVVAVQAVGGVLLIGLIVAGLIAGAVILRPTVAAPASAETPALQAPARDDFAFRQPTTIAGQDDYGLRHNTAPAVATTSRDDDYAARHPLSAAGATYQQAGSDFGQRHSTWKISAQAAVGPDDYGLR